MDSDIQNNKQTTSVGFSRDTSNKPNLQCNLSFCVCPVARILPGIGQSNTDSLRCASVVSNRHPL